MGGGICRAKLHSAFVGLCLDTRLSVRLLVCLLPLSPGLVWFFAIFPIFVGARKYLGGQHRGCREEE